MFKLLAIILSSCIMTTAATSTISANYEQKETNTTKTTELIVFEETVIMPNAPSEEQIFPFYQTRENGTKYYVRILINNVVSVVILTVLGVNDLAEAVKNWVRDQYSSSQKYTYTYTEDTGCWTPEFPANPFCKRII